MRFALLVEKPLSLTELFDTIRIVDACRLIRVECRIFTAIVNVNFEKTSWLLYAQEIFVTVARVRFGLPRVNAVG